MLPVTPRPNSNASVYVPRASADGSSASASRQGGSGIELVWTELGALRGTLPLMVTRRDNGSRRLKFHAGVDGQEMCSRVGPELLNPYVCLKSSEIQALRGLSNGAVCASVRRDPFRWTR
jgi:hypothetical protein